MERCLAFYIDTLQFTMRNRKENYAFIGRDNIFLAAIEIPSQETLEEKSSYRRPTKGLEIVLEVDDLVAERDRIVQNGYMLEDDIRLQDWGLQDFRLVDPDGYCKFRSQGRIR